MPNSNPIKTTDNGTYVSFQIPEALKDGTLYLSATSSMDNDLWKMIVIHSLNVDGDPVDPEADPHIVKKEIGICRELDGIQLALASIVSRIRNGDPGNIPPKVTYRLLLESGETTIDSFELVTDSTNPATLYVKLKFKLQS